ncbi:hypothetical protein K458DRAFT_392422 [Lentithecium fluviatile CBS 122367]|uniref:Uncharacterized protein n=1 Tax=Lentithecium fluviatile CBS 122367 TaxID=1168545 RepID=A0A6G1IR68_9PLEO|nr:hypothetical protein K458DRAFT_392422 [Lentithecium fluviatile CBS 122367]
MAFEGDHFVETKGQLDTLEVREISEREYSGSDQIALKFRVHSIWTAFLGFSPVYFMAVYIERP